MRPAEARRQRRSRSRWRSARAGILAAAGCGAAGLALAGLWGAKPPARAPAALADDAPIPFKTWIPFEEAVPVLAAWPAHVPEALKSKSSADMGASWPDWTLHHDAAIRARLDRGEEDSVVNFWLYGTTFTPLPRATDRLLLPDRGPAGTLQVVEGRLDHLLDAVAAPGGAGRVRFTRTVLARQGINVAAPGGRERAWEYLDQLRTRMAAEEEGYGRTISALGPGPADRRRLATFATLFEARGLSSDTGMPIGFALEQSLADLRASGRLTPGAIDRAAIVGPGLDFTDKAEGYDFYPQQSIQPFALIDSLLRLDLAQPGHLVVTALDISHRVTSHLQAARERAAQGTPYTLQLPLDRNTAARQWDPGLVDYWQRVGDRIGEPVPGASPPAGLEHVRVRAVAVRPAIVQTVLSRNVNVILERLDPLAEGERFDLLVATNVLLYYDPFEQALALVNIARMLRPGGVLITSDAMFPTSPLDTSPAQITEVARDKQGLRDTLFAYQRH